MILSSELRDASGDCGHRFEGANQAELDPIKPGVIVHGAESLREIMYHPFYHQ